MRKRLVCFAAAAVTLAISGACRAQNVPTQNDPTQNAPKNIVLMIIDGLGYNQVEAAGYYLEGRSGSLAFETFPVSLAMSTYAEKGGYDPLAAWRDFRYPRHETTDSAASATALASGVKTYNGAIGVDAEGMPVRTITDVAEDAGKSTGVVTTVPLSHATPAAFAAHNASRGNYEDIATEMIEKSRLEVIFGGGHPYFDDNARPRAKGEFKYVGGPETWESLTTGRAGGDADGDGSPDAWTLIQNRGAFVKLASGQTPGRVFGLPRVAKTLQQDRSSVLDDAKDEPLPYATPRLDVPTLPEMAAAALNVLDDDPDGFFLMLEAGAVDWAGHENQSARMIEEMLDANAAAAHVIAWVEANSSWEETLFIVTGDHETGYLTGPGSGNGDSPGQLWRPIVNNGKGKLPGMAWNSGSHTNALIPIFAKGPGAARFPGQAVDEDPVRGPYIDNTSVGRTMVDLFSGR